MEKGIEITLNHFQLSPLNYSAQHRLIQYLLCVVGYLFAFLVIVKIPECNWGKKRCSR